MVRPPNITIRNMSPAEYQSDIKGEGFYPIIHSHMWTLHLHCWYVLLIMTSKGCREKSFLYTPCDIITIWSWSLVLNRARDAEPSILEESVKIWVSLPVIRSSTCRLQPQLWRVARSKHRPLVAAYTRPKPRCTGYGPLPFALCNSLCLHVIQRGCLTEFKFRVPALSQAGPKRELACRIMSMLLICMTLAA